MRLCLNTYMKRTEKKEKKRQTPVYLKDYETVMFAFIRTSLNWAKEKA